MNEFPNLLTKPYTQNLDEPNTPQDMYQGGLIFASYLASVGKTCFSAIQIKWTYRAVESSFPRDILHLIYNHSYTTP